VVIDEARESRGFDEPPVARVLQAQLAAPGALDADPRVADTEDRKRGRGPIHELLVDRRDPGRRVELHAQREVRYLANRPSEQADRRRRGIEQVPAHPALPVCLTGIFVEPAAGLLAEIVALFEVCGAVQAVVAGPELDLD